MGWNRVRVIRSGPAGVPGDDAYAYFVHSYIAEPANPDDIAATTVYGEEFPSIVVRDNIWGTQFHPEKSGPTGRALLRAFASGLLDAPRTVAAWS